jgi:hypothetical protein
VELPRRPILTQLWLAMFAEVIPYRLGMPWTRTIDVLAAVAGSNYAETNTHSAIYRRNVACEMFCLMSEIMC